MTNEKLIEVFTRYRVMMPLPAERADPTLKATKPTTAETCRHIAYMCEMGLDLVKQGRREKAMRWLGFVQGWLWAQGEYSALELGEHSMPDGAAPNAEMTTKEGA